MAKLLRQPAVRERLGGISKQKLRELINGGRLTLLALGERARAVAEDDVDALIAELAAERAGAQKLLDAAVDLHDEDAVAAALRGLGYARAAQQRFFADRCVRTALDLKREQA